MSSGSACWILWLTPMDWLALSIGRSGSQPLEYSLKVVSVHYEKSDLIVRVVDDEDKLSGKIMIPDIADVYISIFGNRT